MSSTACHVDATAPTLQDPDGILAAPKGGHIARRTLAKQVAQDQELTAQLEAERLKGAEELRARREVRSPLRPA